VNFAHQWRGPMETEQPRQGSQRSDGSDGADRRADPKQAAFAAAKEAREGIESQAEAQRARMSDSARHAAGAAQQAAQNLRGSEPWVASLIGKGADSLADLAETLRRNNLRDLLSRAEEFARQQPVLFTGLAMALGFTATRAARANAPGQAGSKHERGTDPYADVEEYVLEH
jgi:hypothetical protein